MEITIQEIQAEISQQQQQFSETASLDAQVLLAHFLDKPRSWVLARPEYQLSDKQFHAIQLAQSRLNNGEALPYIIGHWEFFGLNFNLTPDVLIPRPETELLVERAISWLQDHPHKRRVIDVGTGSGCIGISIAKHVPEIHLVLTDISAPALKVARQNLEKHQMSEKTVVRQSDLLGQTPRSSAYDLICANLPYIPSSIVDHLLVSKKEPRLALDGGSDGLELISRLLKQAKSQLEAGGLILLEIDPSQSDRMIQLSMQHFGGSRTRILKDLTGRDRCVEIETRYMIYHLCPRSDWVSSLKKGEYEADSIFTEGFIHCSKPDQIIDVANRYYQGVPDLVILAIDPEKLASEIRWESVGTEYYPHIYGSINLEAVCSVDDISPDSDGTYTRFTHG
jgi:release factor glutamine methyltransferase